MEDEGAFDGAATRGTLVLFVLFVVTAATPGPTRGPLVVLAFIVGTAALAAARRPKTIIVVRVVVLRDQVVREVLLVVVLGRSGAAAG